MTESTDNFYTFSSSELAEIKETYQLLLADKHTHNRQFKKRDRFLRSRSVGLAIGMLLCLSSTLLLTWANYDAHLPVVSLTAILDLLAAILCTLVLIFFKIQQHFNQRQLRLFPTGPIRYNHTPYLKTFHLQQMIKLPDYLIVWPVAKERSIMPTPDQVSCWIIRKADQSTLYNQLSTTYYNNLLKNPKASRWVDYWLIDGTKKDD